MGPFSQKQPFASREIVIQGHSVRQVWGLEDPVSPTERKPIRRDPVALRAAPEQTDCELRIRLGEELDFARRMLDATGDDLANDPIAISRHTVALQYLDRVGQMLGHIADVVRSTDPHSAVDAICMSDLRARLRRSGAL